MMQDTLNSLSFPQPKNKFIVSLIDNETGKVVDRQEFENTVGKQMEQCANLWYKKFPTPAQYIGGIDNYMGRTDTGINMVLWGADAGITDTLYLNESKFSAVGNNIPTAWNSDANSRVTGYNYQFAQTDSGTKGGRYVPSLSGNQRNRAYKWVWEWGTTQANGTISALSLSGPTHLNVASARMMLDIGHVPEMSNASRYTYAGYKTSGPDKHIYFASRDVVSNNVVVLKASDKSLISQKTITNPTGLWSTPQKDIIFTPVSGGQWYGIVSTEINAPGFTFKKGADGASITFGSSTAVTTSFPASWTQMNFYSWTADESFIYALVYNQSNTEQAILTFNPATDTIVSVTKRHANLGGVNGASNSQLWNICPNTGKLISLYNADTGMVDTSITSVSDTIFGAFRWADNDFLNTNSYKTFAMFNAAGNLETAYAVHTDNVAYYGAFFERSLGNFYTQAVLPSSITKTSSQSLRVEYTLNY